MLWDTLFLCVHSFKHALGLGIALFRGAAVPTDRVGIVLGYAVSKVIHDPENELGGRVPQRCKWPKAGKRDRIILSQIRFPCN